MKRTRRAIDATLKTKIVLEALRANKSVVDLAQQYGVHPNQIYTWKKQVENHVVSAFDPQTRQIAELKAKISRDASATRVVRESPDQGMTRSWRESEGPDQSSA
jgi:transposase-like protein